MNINSLLRAAALALVLAAPAISVAQAQPANADAGNVGYYDSHDGQLTRQGTPLPGSAWDSGN